MPQLKVKMIPNLANKYQCTACLACENICPVNAIQHKKKKDGHIYIFINEQKCIGCLKCEKICSSSRSFVGNNNLSASQIYAAWNTDCGQRKYATSGGVFPAVAEIVLANNGCVIGAKINGFECKHEVIYKKEDIWKLQGSKYMYSSMEDVYATIEKELPHRDVLFSGLGCQCAGVLAYFKNFVSNNKLITIDLVCGGIPSDILIQKYKSHHPNVKGLISFRKKDKYLLTVNTDAGNEDIKEKSLPLHGFNCGLTNRYCCYDCQFAKAHRKTDFTIGDLWDYNIEPLQHKKGISMVISHSQNGDILLSCAHLQIKPISWKAALLSNKRIICGHQHIYYPRKRLIRNHYSDNKFFKLYTISMKPKDFSLFLFRIYRFLFEKILSIKNKKMINKLIKSNTKL